MDKLAELVSRVIEWDRKTAHDYDQRWINLHGMNIVLMGLDKKTSPDQTIPLSLPAEQWDRIAEKTRADYRDGFQKILVEAQNKSSQPDYWLSLETTIVIHPLRKPFLKLLDCKVLWAADELMPELAE